MCRASERLTNFDVRDDWLEVPQTRDRVEIVEQEAIPEQNEKTKLVHC